MKENVTSMSRATIRAAWLLCATLLEDEGRAAEARRAYWNAIRPWPPTTWFNGQPLMRVVDRAD